jgi:hypothetical protein
MGDSFWLESEHRIKEVTQTLEDKLEKALNGELKGKIPLIGEANVSARLSHTNTLTTQEKADIIRYGQPVVEQVQMRKLGQVMEVIENDILSRPVEVMARKRWLIEYETPKKLIRTRLYSR